MAMDAGRNLKYFIKEKGLIFELENNRNALPLEGDKAHKKLSRFQRMLWLNDLTTYSHMLISYSTLIHLSTLVIAKLFVFSTLQSVSHD